MGACHEKRRNSQTPLPTWYKFHHLFTFHYGHKSFITEANPERSHGKKKLGVSNLNQSISSTTSNINPLANYFYPLRNLLFCSRLVTSADLADSQVIISIISILLTLYLLDLLGHLTTTKQLLRRPQTKKPALIQYGHHLLPATVIE